MKFFLRVFLLFIFLFCSLESHANSIFFPQYLEQTPIYAIVNPAGSVNEKDKFQVQLVCENRFLLKDLIFKTIAFGKSYKQHSWNLLYNEWGTRYYKNRLYFVNYSTRLFEDFRIGMTLNFKTIHQQNLAKFKPQLFPTIGLEYKINKYNMLFSSFLHSKNQNSSTTQFELFYQKNLQPELDLRIGFSANSIVEISAFNTYVTRLALLFNFNNNHKVVLEFNTSSQPLYFSYRQQWKNFTFNLAVSYHTQLNISQQVSFNYTQE